VFYQVSPASFNPSEQPRFGCILTQHIGKKNVGWCCIKPTPLISSHNTIPILDDKKNRGSGLSLLHFSK
jgi:hypothetical protein